MIAVNKHCWPSAAHHEHSALYGGFPNIGGTYLGVIEDIYGLSRDLGFRVQSLAQDRTAAEGIELAGKKRSLRASKNSEARKSAIRQGLIPCIPLNMMSGLGI